MKCNVQVESNKSIWYVFAFLKRYKECEDFVKRHQGLYQIKYTFKI